MNDIYDLQLFVTVAERGSFAAAGATHNLTPSAVGKRVAQLEARLRVQLLERTTRKLVLTPAGRHYLDRARVLVHEMAALEHSVRHLSSDPAGEVSMSCNVGVSERFVLPLLPEFLKQYPRVRVNLMVGDRMESAESDGSDLVIRPAGAPLANYVSRRLGGNPWVVCASPAYLNEHGMPRTPDDLLHHNCLNVGLAGATSATWLFEVEGQVRPIAVSGNFGGFANAAYLMTRAGVGIGRLPNFLVRDDIDNGALVRVLPDHMVADSRAVYLFYRNLDPMPSRLHVLVEYLSLHLGHRLAAG